MSTELIELRESQLAIADGIATLTHLKPAARNALSLELREDYVDMLDRLETDRSIRALIITGSGGSFCAGGDIRSLKERQLSSDPEINSANAMRLRIRRLHGWLERLRGLEIPVIAAVDGPAYGAGFAIALLADFILASERASFCLPFAKLGLVPDSGALYTLPRAVGLQKAKELLFSARRVAAEEARELGIVHSIHSPEELATAAHWLARRFLASPRDAIALSKRLLNQSSETPWATMAELEGLAQGIASTTPYHDEAVSAFLRGEPSRYDWDRD
ncbi:enoyl-CoA hydratase/isomerase family protein [Pseudomonas sp. BGr12]|uniref:enoyl-CoA hydratase/isomerase family protein n=1 Tax=unclassified Pseudomonas TaxID=196821 RepID=UPI00177CE288|nr:MULTISPECIES: enoyl-CoA hydratase/isomerase family protein [unclassified Pseudomonas]MBD9500590.1 enoyl-CoA hydratase/isomerase family protein [Pseudomonas sp. PDM17]MBD9577726.1 enoyl-CoA hydratase/isomerase family protein [Pseudomonas sp. PDM23]MBD9672286.1 enoyl-CoA hydratase/isomerase family protein [Pseudomonas sp. PDM21]MDL2430768.1 enoyl-CoA hydratase/isomerase family protein [Pseudomonas sp. BJa5]